jgi:putative SOS response-associated peptidase YedK
MCNYYQNDIRKAGRMFEVYGFDEFSETRIHPDLLTLPYDIYPDRLAAVAVLGEDGTPDLTAMRWGFPPVDGAFVTNVRNLASPFWRPWLKPAQRCLVPAVRFSEWSAGPPKGERWFSLASEEPMFLAGIWRPWTGARGPKSRPIEGEHKLFAFLTCPPNEVVAPVHPKAMPVILRPGEARTWLEAPTEVALQLQKPLPAAELVLEPLSAPPPKSPARTSGQGELF